MTQITEQAPAIPDYKQELISWLSGYQRTERIIAIVKTQAIGPAEAAAWRRDFEKWLTPRKLERSNRGAH